VTQTAFEVVGEARTGRWVVTCDHATNIAERAYYLQTGKQLTADVQELHRTQIKA